jgi:formiminotetrahydrofolate cyclodeaminase
MTVEQPVPPAPARDHLLCLPVRDFVAAVAAREPTPGGGAVAALTVALAAGLVAMAARFSDRHLHDGTDLAELADRLRDRAASLVEQDAQAYQAVRAASATQDTDPDARRERLKTAWLLAIDVPLHIARAGVAVADIGARVAGGNPNLTGDVHTAIRLADAAVHSCAELVRINVRLGDLDDESAWLADAYAARVRGVARTTTADYNRSGGVAAGMP